MKNNLIYESEYYNINDIDEMIEEYKKRFEEKLKENIKKNPKYMIKP